MSEKMTEITAIITNITNITHTTDTTHTTTTIATMSAQACMLLARQAEHTVTGAGSSRHLRNTPGHIRSRKTMNPTPNNRITKCIDNHVYACYSGGKSSVLRVLP
jgi:hypothetical protein